VCACVCVCARVCKRVLVMDVTAYLTCGGDSGGAKLESTTRRQSPVLVPLSTHSAPPGCVPAEGDASDTVVRLSGDCFAATYLHTSEEEMLHQELRKKKKGRKEETSFLSARKILKQMRKIFF
jgi:hypothetical protein